MTKTNNKLGTITSKKIDSKIKFNDTSMMNDLRFSSSLDNNPTLATFILKIVLEKEDLVVKEITTQKRINNLTSKTITLDAYAIDSKNRYYNIEIQKAKTKDIILRSRYHMSIIDSNNLEKNNDFSKLPETYVIFFCNFDLFKENKPIYKVERVVNFKKLFNDKEHIVFVNCTYQDLTTDIGKLIHDMKSKIGEEKCYNIFSESDEIGEENMGQICDSIRQEGIKIGENRGLAQGIEIGEANGIKKGEENITISIITSMLESGYEVEEISKITKKTKEYILSIKNKLK